MKLTTDVLESYLAKARRIESETGALTVRDFMTACGYYSTNTASIVMWKMAERGMLRTFPRGENQVVFRVNPEYKQEDPK